ncbi:glutaredoxin family protein, partial [Robiginitalea sp.]|uniref:glutaredoxin family protein n=1 Tax=Robiginitalea sp. TaxID=1902411 RepID=UPI003C70A1B8
MEFMDGQSVPYVFRDVEAHEEYAQELRALCENGKLNFPTLMVGEKCLRNPSEKEVRKWIAPRLAKSNMVL